MILQYVTMHLYNFACTRFGNTEVNETLHKINKESYNATNRGLDLLSMQILTVRSISEFENDRVDDRILIRAIMRQYKILYYQF